MPVPVVAHDRILDGLGPAPVFLEMHYWEAKQIPPGFQLLASTADCPVQLMRQIDRPSRPTVSPGGLHRMAERPALRVGQFDLSVGL